MRFPFAKFFVAIIVIFVYLIGNVPSYHISAQVCLCVWCSPMENVCMWHRRMHVCGTCVCKWNIKRKIGAFDVYYPRAIVCCSYMYPYTTHRLPCLYILVCYSYVSRMLLVCFSYVTRIIYFYVTRMYSSVTRMLLVCVRMSSHVLFCYSYVLVCYSYVTRMLLVCYSYVTRMLLVCYSYVTRYVLVCTRAVF